MVAQIFCLTSGSGMPIFIRKKGDAETLSFSQIASLNGVHLFAKSHDVTLLNTNTEDSVVCWREFHGSIMLIGFASSVSTTILDKLLESVFNAMVLCVGIDELTNIRNVERLKRELRVAYRLIDKLLDCLESGDKTQGTRSGTSGQKSVNGDINDFVETISCQENQAIQNCLESFIELIDSLYGSVSIHGRLAIATTSWWELEHIEKKLLNIMISVVGSNSTSSDVPVFLPFKSPSVPFRLVTLRLINGVDISMLCGPTPSLNDIEQSVLQVWRPMIEMLRSAEKTYPRNFPANITLDNNVLGFLLINIATGKYLISRNLNKKESCSLSGSHRLNILRTFYNQSASVFLLPEGTGKLKKTEGEAEANAAALETYWCSEYHKCHGLRSATNLICVLYAASVPTHTMRILTKHCLKALISEKHLCW